MIAITDIGSAILSGYLQYLSFKWERTWLGVSLVVTMMQLVEPSSTPCDRYNL